MEAMFNLSMWSGMFSFDLSDDYIQWRLKYKQYLQVYNQAYHFGNFKLENLHKWNVK